MKEKYLLNNILTLSKSLINLYTIAEMESCNIKVKKIFNYNLNKSLEMQYKLFKEMKKNNYYKLENINNDLIKNTYNKLKNGLM